MEYIPFSSGGNMRIGDLVRIRQSFSRKRIGKLAIVVDATCSLNPIIHIIDTGQVVEFDVRKLEVLCR